MGIARHPADFRDINANTVHTQAIERNAQDGNKRFITTHARLKWRNKQKKCQTLSFKRLKKKGHSSTKSGILSHLNPTSGFSTMAVTTSMMAGLPYTQKSSRQIFIKQTQGTD
ncbi:MAG TPA: hypothetical protein DCS88_11330 [Alphaproteobacteria bacterium]|nr:hypothetical protein [Alphaproteobacteria bacterium]